MPDSAFSIRFFDVVLSVSRSLDLLSPALSDHHLRVSYVAACIADALGRSAQEKRDTAVAGALHDVGAVSLSSRLSLLHCCLSNLRLSTGGQEEDVHRHGFDGYLLLRDFIPFADAARTIRFHHVDWDFGRGSEFGGEEVPFASHILRLADHVAILPDCNRNILDQSAGIRKLVDSAAGILFREDIVAAFEEVASREAFWLDLVSAHKEEIVRPFFGEHDVTLTSDELYELTKLFGKIIDFRSPFTAMHSANVAATSELLAELAGLSVQEKRILGLAGYLHDLGKLAVPSEILDKPDRLTHHEELVIRQHPYYTHRILSMIPGLEKVATYGALHHERLDGGGYPFRSREVPFGSRIVAVADVFSAVTENRPYRDGMNWKQTIASLDALVADGGLDGDIVALVRENADLFIEFVRDVHRQAEARVAAGTVE
ncbi:MAG TPA: HD domain-containing phosphohydrolase [Noviherbaspirillum sp.]